MNPFITKETPFVLGARMAPVGMPKGIDSSLDTQ